MDADSIASLNSGAYLQYDMLGKGVLNSEFLIQHQRDPSSQHKSMLSIIGRQPIAGSGCSIESGRFLLSGNIESTALFLSNTDEIIPHLLSGQTRRHGTFSQRGM